MKKILVIDDTEFVLESTSTLLRFEGYEVFTASDGIKGVEAAQMYQPDMILCDISMPGLDGYEVLDMLRKNPSTSLTPFIFLTAFTEKPNMRMGMEKGADDFIVKPFTRDELIAAIDAQWVKYSLFAQQVKDKVEEVGRNVSYALPHEFRTVLNEVINSAKYLQTSANTVEPDEIKELTDDIILSSNRLMKITENFLIFVRIQSFSHNEEMRQQLRTYFIEEAPTVFEDLSKMKANSYNRSNDLVFNISAKSLTLEVSTENFHIIVDELLDNSLKFSDSGTKLYLDLWVDNRFMFVSLKDEGRGMSKEQIDSISALSQFERTIYEQQGIGLGLVIAKKMVELHDGSFVIESEESQGTRVIFSLPIKK